MGDIKSQQDTLVEDETSVSVGLCIGCSLL